MSGELENEGKRGSGGKEKKWTDCMADDLRLFGITGDWSTAALDPGLWYSAVHKGGCRFMAASEERCVQSTADRRGGQG